MKILQLPETLANQIAAGEVVERPASVVKELIENSIDANSTWIRVDLKEAGLEHIKVTDNGDGISKEDCERAFLRHATSKIRDETDLFRVQTLGFRGEALASIASVSKLTLKTSEGNEAGTYLKLEGGKIVERDKCSARKGTEISVDELFFNTPARLKYMKTLHTELGHITDLLMRIAFAHPEIRIEATHNDRNIFKTTGSGNVLQVISQVYGMDVARGMLEVEEETVDFTINGYISKPEITRASRSYITFIINGRYIHNNPLQHAILRAYHTLLPMRRYPIVVLSITMDPYLVDVNVHPTKLEVRFSKEKELVEVIENVLRTALRETSLIPKIKHQQSMRKEKSTQDHLPLEFQRKKQINKKDQIDSLRDHHSSQKLLTNENHAKRKSFQVLEQTHTKTNYKTDDENETNFKNHIPIFYPIGQLHGTYIIAQNEDGMYMIDQHAAQERIKYEEYKEKLSQPVNHLQDLFIPITLEFTQQENLFLKENIEVFKKIGLFFEPFGQQTYRIRSHPTWFPSGTEEDIIRDIVDQFIKRKKLDIKEIRDETAMLMACKRSIRANESLTTDEMFQLLEDLRKTSDPFTCPHGRPVIIHFSTKEIEKMFKRIL